jgi:hypothetical protein
MSEQSPVIDPNVLAAAVEVLRLVNDPTAMADRLAQLAAASKEAASRIAAADAAFDRLLQAQVERENTLKGTTAQQQAEHAARLKYLITRESEFDTRERRLAADRVRVANNACFIVHDSTGHSRARCPYAACGPVSVDA